MIYYKYKTKVELMDSEGAYFMPDDMGFATSLLNKGMFSTEVNIINDFKHDMLGKMEGKNFIDIGANVGTYTMVLAPIFNHTYAFEPNRHVYNIMCGNIALHNLSEKTTLVNMGLSDKDEVLTYKMYDELGGGNAFVKNDGCDVSNVFAHMYDWCVGDTVNTQSLRVGTLDSFGIRDVGLIKLDVEGFELNVLKGAVDTIEKSGYPTLIVESWFVKPTDSIELSEAKTKLRGDLFAFLGNIGYKIDREIGDVFIFTH